MCVKQLHCFGFRGKGVKCMVTGRDRCIFQQVYQCVGFVVLMKYSIKEQTQTVKNVLNVILFHFQVNR